MEISFSSIASKMKASKIRELMKYASMPGVISFGGGMPDPLNFPFKDVKDIINNWDSDKIISAMQYGPTSGFPPLVEKLKERMALKRNIDLNDQELIVTTGGQQAIFLTSKIFVDEGDVIIIEQPSFIGAIASFLSNGAKLEGVPLEDDGVNVKALEKIIINLQNDGKGPKFFYTIPNFQNPGGYTMSLDKRKVVYDLAIKYNLIILEDDPYCDLYFTENDDQYVPIKSLGNDAKVIYLGSFSKIMCPGFRLGWMIGDKQIIEKAALSKQSIDACSSSFGQVVAYDYLEQNLIDKYLENMRKIYKEKKEHMIKCIREYFPEGVKTTDPDGGFFIYIDLPEGVNADDVFKKAFEEKIAFVSGEPFHIDPFEGLKHIRLSYSNSGLEQINKGIEVIGRAIKQLM